MTDKPHNNNRKKEKTEDIWDISIYTDDEIIHNILNMSNPTDRELEMKIWTYIKNYQQQPPTPQNKQWLKFYEQIYERLFTFEKEGFNENLEDDEYASDQEESEPEINPKKPTKSTQKTKKTKKTIESLTNNSQTNNENNTTNTVLVKQTDYIKGSLNPILKETITRTLTIDSQYRENKNEVTTQFSLNLTETIRDVVSIKLYSVHIPYTWYIISTDYGSNYFYLQGIAPGIDNDKNQYQITIPAGNYTQAALATNINASIQQTLVQTNTDICFGTTALNYNPNDSLMTFTIDIQNIFAENFYYLEFPLKPPATYISPIDAELNRIKTITSFLGFTDLSYSITTITSKTNLEQNIDINSATRVISSNPPNNVMPNNQILFYQYLGPTIDSKLSILNPQQDPNFLQKYTITIPDNIYSKDTLTNEINNQLQQAPFLQNSSFSKYTITDSSNSYYKFNLQLNRKTTVNQQNAKLAVLLPNDISLNIWTPSGSCFEFTPNQPSINEMSGNVLYSYYPFYINSLNSEYESLQTNYQIDTSSQIIYTCITPPWNVPQNNVKLTLAPSTGIGYILSEYINAINNSITTYSNNNNNILNLIDTNSFVGSTDYKFHLRTDLNKTFDQTSYRLDLTDSSLNSLNSGSSYFTFYDNNNDPITYPYDMSTNNVFNYVLNLPSNTITMITGSTLMNIYVNPSISPSKGNQNDTSYNIIFTSTKENGVYNRLIDLKNDIEQSIRNYKNPLSNQNPLTSTTFSSPSNQSSNIWIGTMTINLLNALTESNYTLSFVDPLRSWSTNFDVSDNATGTDISYALANFSVPDTTYSEIIGNRAIFNTEIYISDLSGNDTFQLSPLSTSEFLQSNLIPNPNSFTFTIPTGLYTRDKLINTMNDLLKSNSITNQSSFSVVNINGLEYTNVLININKLFTSSDYEIVFYDDTHFTKCAFGVSQVGVTTWDTTLGWILGFRENTTYGLKNYITNVSQNLTSQITNNLSNICVLTADTTCSTTLYNYFIITLDDYNQNHVNDGLVTITTTETSIPIPSYATLSNFICNPITGLYAYTGIVKQGDAGIYNNLTQKQIYAITEIMNNNPNAGYETGNTHSTKYSKGPFIRDVLAVVPIKTAGVINGQTIIIDSGSLQNQNRVYFGPVNINRLNISLMDDRGHVVNLNNSNWSFTLLIDQLYKKSGESGSK
jgi:hypothetical protein